MSMPFQRLISTLEPLETEETREPKKVFGATERFVVALACTRAQTITKSRIHGQSHVPSRRRARVSRSSRKGEKHTRIRHPSQTPSIPSIIVHPRRARARATTARERRARGSIYSLPPFPHPLSRSHPSRARHLSREMR